MLYPSSIQNLTARQILDSRGNPTVEVDVLLEDGCFGRASVPSGASTGRHEAVELRDKDRLHFSGKGVVGVCKALMIEVEPAIVGMSALEQQKIDATLIDLDGTENKSRLGANAILAVSLAVAKAAAQHCGLPLYKYLGGVGATSLPCPFFNVINGGAHAANPLDIQEFMVVPVGASSFSQALQWGTEVYHHLKNVLNNKGYATNVGDEGGFAPALSSADEALDLMLIACENAGFMPGKDIAFGLDVAATELYSKGGYTLSGFQEPLTHHALTDYYAKLITQYPIVSIEDGMAEDDWEGWTHMTRELGSRVQLVGDDLFVTNPNRLKTGFTAKAANAILIKPNQIGTLTETMATVHLATAGGYRSMMSHRSGETEDTTIADLVVALGGVGCQQIKAGAPCRTDRLAKYNQLLRIEEDLFPYANYAGWLPLGGAPAPKQESSSATKS